MTFLGILTILNFIGLGLVLLLIAERLRFSTSLCKIRIKVIFDRVEIDKWARAQRFR